MKILNEEELSFVSSGSGVATPQYMAYSQMVDNIVDFTSGFFAGFYAAF